MQEGRVVVWKGFTIAEKKREVKGNGEREIYPTECRVPENSKKR